MLRHFATGLLALACAGPAHATPPTPGRADFPAAGPAPEPRAPLRLDGVCPGECCTYREWITTADTTIYRNARDTRRVLAVLPRDTRFVGQRGFVHMTRLGTAEARRPVETRSAGAGPGRRGDVVIPKGARVIVLDEIGEGYFRVWYAGRVYQLQVYDRALIDAPWFDDPAAGLAFTRTPQSRWWARARLADGRVGWVDMDRAPLLRKVDGCGPE